MISNLTLRFLVLIFVSFAWCLPHFTCFPVCLVDRQQRADDAYIVVENQLNVKLVEGVVLLSHFAVVISFRIRSLTLEVIAIVNWKAPALASKPAVGAQLACMSAGLEGFRVRCSLRSDIQKIGTK